MRRTANGAPRRLTRFDPIDFADHRTALSLNNRNEDIYQLVCRLGRQRMFLVEHDKGAGIASGYAAAHADPFRRMAVMETVIAATKPLRGLESARSLWHPGFYGGLDIAESLTAGRERMYPSWFTSRRPHRRFRSLVR